MNTLVNVAGNLTLAGGAERDDWRRFRFRGLPAHQLYGRTDKPDTRLGDTAGGLLDGEHDGDHGRRRAG